MRLTELRANHIEKPMGFQLKPLSLSWKVQEAGQAQSLRAARICIYEGNKKIYDGGMEENVSNMDYPVSLLLKPRTRYRWTVEVFADNGDSSKAESWFETGKMNEPWQGKWITPVDRNLKNPVLSRRFYVKETGEARFYFCGLGVYEIYVNGKKVGDEYLAPGYHSYDFHLQIQTYDVTKYLNEGENILQIWLGDGWYKGRFGFEGGYTDLYGDKYYALGELYVRNDNGEDELLAVTDEGWQVKESPIVFANIYDGEIYDAQREEGLALDMGWSPVCLEKPKQECLSDRYSLPVVVKEVLYPVSMVTAKEELLLDFRQNMTGWVEFECQLPAGYKIRLTASEILQDGCFYKDNYRTAKAEYVYISGGSRAHVRPHFTFYGFRYMKIEFFNEKNQVLQKKQTEEYETWVWNFKGCHLRSDFEQTGWITTGNQKVNQLISNALWSQKDNFLDVPTDCPQRDERLGWTGDAQIFADTACYNMYVPGFYRKYMWDMRAEQRAQNGAGVNVVPLLKRGMLADPAICPWADAAAVIPWKVYLHYGDCSLLGECYPGIKDWVEYQLRRDEDSGSKRLIQDGFHFADWLALDNPKPGPLGATDPYFIASIYYYYVADIAARSAQILGYENDRQKYKKLSEEIYTAIREEYFDKAGNCKCKTQTGEVLTIEFNLDEGSNRHGKELEDMIRKNGGNLNTGFVGTPFLCSALTKSGFNKTAVDLLLNEKFPGWLYSVNMGATTIWERWNSVEEDGHMNPEGMNSLNHYTYGSILTWMYEEMCGIHMTEPGFKKVRIEPHPDARLGFADMLLETPMGTYRIRWSYTAEENVRYDVEIPFDAEADVVIQGQTRLLKAGKYHF